MGDGCLTEARSHDALVFFFYCLLWRPSCSAEQDGLSNFGRGSPKEHFCEIIEQDLSPDRIARLILHILFLENSKSVTLIWT